MSYEYQEQKVKHIILKYPEEKYQSMNKAEIKELLQKDINNLIESIRHHQQKKAYKFIKVLLVANRYSKTPSKEERNFKERATTSTQGRPENAENIAGELSPHFHLLVTAKPLYSLTEHIKNYWSRKNKQYKFNDKKKYQFKNIKNNKHLENVLEYILCQKLFFRSIGTSKSLQEIKMQLNIT